MSAQSQTTEPGLPRASGCEPLEALMRAVCNAGESLDGLSIERLIDQLITNGERK